MAEKDPFQGFKLTKKEVVKNPMSREELKRLTEKVFEVERISQVRDIFLFCCYTGLAYVDVKQLKTTDVVVGMDGEPWIDTTRQKTDARESKPRHDRKDVFRLGKLLYFGRIETLAAAVKHLSEYVNGLPFSYRDLACIAII